MVVAATVVVTIVAVPEPTHWTHSLSRMSMEVEVETVTVDTHCGHTVPLTEESVDEA